jgi:hypothetical protein
VQPLSPPVFDKLAKISKNVRVFKSPSFVLRHVGVVKQMYGEVYTTVDEMAAEFDDCSDTGCFLL